MEREEARVLHLLLRPAEFEEVVRCLQPLLHLGIVLDDNAVEDSVNRPHALHLVVVLQCAKHSASQGGEVVINVGVSIAVNRSKGLLVRHERSFGISTHKLDDDGAFGHCTGLRQTMADTDVVPRNVHTHVVGDADHNVLRILVRCLGHPVQANVFATTVLRQPVDIKRL